jgi:hypothetical protein
MEYEYSIYVSLIIRGKDLDPQKIMEIIKVIPSRSFKRGDKRKDLQEWPHGYWELGSWNNIESTDLSVHLKWLVEKIEPYKRELVALGKEESFDAEVSCFWIMPNSHESLTLSSDLLAEISSWELGINFDIYAPD